MAPAISGGIAYLTWKLLESAFWAAIVAGGPPSVRPNRSLHRDSNSGDGSTYTGRRQPIVISSWPKGASEPLLTTISFTVPETGDAISFSIFIASSLRTT